MPSRRKSTFDASPAGKKSALAKPSTTAIGLNPLLVADLRQIILSAREQVARAVDSGLVLLYWSIGHRIRTDVLKKKRAEYGQKILHAVSAKLVTEFGQGFTARNLANMTRFAEVFPDLQIVSALGRQLSWTHFRSIIYLDLLFYHRHLRRMVAVELKIGEFKAAYKGQMELYLAWLDRHERAATEEKPIGLILCAGKKDETIELLDMEKDGIRVSSYWTETLPKDLLRKKLHQAVATARALIAERKSAVSIHS